MKNLGVDRQGVPLTMRQKDLWGYGAGGLAMATITGFMGQMVYFYTDKVGFSAAMAGSALLVSKILDGLSDLIMGFLVDRTKTRWGKARPYILWMVLPTILAIALLFSMPKDLSDGLKFAYAVLTNTFATAIVYTAIVIPLNCLMYFRSRSLLERTKMGIRRTFMNIAMGMLINIIFIPITSKLGGTQQAWILVGALIAAVGAFGLFICFMTTKEVNYDVEKEEVAKVPFLECVGILFKNKYWVLIAVSRVLVEMSLNVSNGVYYARWIFGDESLYAIMGLISLLPTILGFFIITPLVKKFSQKDVCRYSVLIGVVGAIGKAVFAHNLIAVALFSALMYFAIMPFCILDNIMLSDIADFEEWRSGRKMIGIVNSASSFGQKIGAGLGSALLGLILTIGGYQAAASSQSDSAIASIYAVSIWIPAIILILLFLLLSAYNLDKKYPHFRTELVERNKQKEQSYKEVVNQ